MQNNTNPADNLIQRIIDVELDVENKRAALRQKYPDYDKEKAEIDKLEEEVDEAKKKLTKYLGDNQDFDTHKVSGHNVSVTRIVKLEVENMDDVPEDLKEMKTDWAVNMEEAKNRAKVLGGTIPGFKDKSYYRLNFKKAKNV